MTDEARPPSDPGPEPECAPTTGDAPGEPPEAPARGDLGRKIALGAMGALVVVGGVLIAASPRGAAPPAPALATGATLTGADVASEDAGEVSVPSVTAPASPAPEPFVPVWRVAAMKEDPAIEVSEGTFGKRSFSAALAQAGVPKSEVRRLARAFEGVRRIEHPASTEAFVVARDRAKGTVVAFELVRSPFEIWQIKADADGRLVAKQLELHVEHRAVGAAVAITEDLTKALAAAGLREEIAPVVDEALEGRHDTITVKPGVRIRVAATEDWVEGAFVRYHVDALEVLPKSGAPLRLYHYERDARTRGSRRSAPVPGFYDAKAQQPYRGAFRSPVPLARVTSRFNPRRMHPVLKVIKPHNGVDYGAKTGTPVYASGAGTVTSVGNGGPCGNMVEIAHAGGITTAYCHLSRFATGLRPGQHVEARQLVGYVGQTGRVTGPHLHFAVKRRGVFIDPFALKLDGVRVLPPVDREVFAERRATLDAALDAIPLPVAPDAPEAKEEAEEDLHAE